jgi:hypothetical protein
MTSISTHRLIVSFACACTTSSFLTANDATLGILLFVKSVKSVCGVNMCISLSFCDQKKIVRVFFVHHVVLFAAQNIKIKLFLSTSL